MRRAGVQVMPGCEQGCRWSQAAHPVVSSFSVGISFFSSFQGI